MSKLADSMGMRDFDNGAILQAPRGGVVVISKRFKFAELTGQGSYQENIGETCRFQRG
jgi:hypothetical protein